MSRASDSGLGRLGSAALIAATIGLVPVGYWAYCRLSYIDKSVTSGSAYGFTIGQSKQETYVGLKALLGDQCFLSIKDDRLVLGKRLHAASRPIHLTDEDFKTFSDSDEWILFADARDSIFSTIDLVFSGGQLRSIHRHHQQCEGP